MEVKKTDTYAHHRLCLKPVGLKQAFGAGKKTSWVDAGIGAGNPTG